jgi:micrococcal nuclease
VATVIDVTDGDTVKVELANGSTETVRLLGVDTPEVYSDNSPEEFKGVPETKAGRDCLRDWGHKATAFARDRLQGEHVRLTFDDNEGRRGYYGRFLAYIHVDGELFNYKLVNQGYARVYDSQFEKRQKFYASESKAQQAGTGLWTCATEDSDKATTTSDGDESNSDAPTVDENATRSDALAISSVTADAPGNDNNNLNEETVTIKNTGNHSLSLSGLTISDSAGHELALPVGDLAAGSTLTIHSGSGNNSTTHVYWGSGSAIWNNDGDTVVITNAEGQVVAIYDY